MKAIDEVGNLIRDKWVASGHIPEDLFIDPDLWTRAVRERGGNPDAADYLMVLDCKVYPNCALEYDDGS